MTKLENEEWEVVNYDTTHQLTKFLDYRSIYAILIGLKKTKIPKKEHCNLDFRISKLKF